MGMAYVRGRDTLVKGEISAPLNDGSHLCQNLQ